VLYATIMAGGAGTRLWPESRRERPKQLLEVQPGKTMIQATVDRLGDLVEPQRVLIATTEQLAGTIHEQLSQLPPESFVCEPCPRNTAPCIALAAQRVVREDPEGTMVVLPADHVISPDDAFRRAIRSGAELVEEEPRRLVTFGIRPAHASESFGYIERDRELETGAASRDEFPAAYRVKQFHEKPEAEVAQQYLETGRFYWNAGIFLWKAKTVLDALRHFEPEMFSHLERIAEAADTDRFAEVLRREFAAIDGKSIDYAVMEPAAAGRPPGDAAAGPAFEVVVIEAPFHWDDVGGWRSLERLGEPDEHGNVIDAERYINHGATGTIVRSRDPKHVVALVGVHDLIVVVTPDATLIANREDEESVREVIAELKRRGWEEHL
jgi:mannose-1-phosphate guanylyltransferase